ncbi:MAG: DUF433 domain-containing protein [Acidobacteriota bacterium]
MLTVDVVGFQRARLSSPSEWVGVGVYAYPEAARLLRTRVVELRRWGLGYHYGRGSNRVDLPPLVRTDFPTVRRQHVLSFLDLMELGFVREFRRVGLSLQAIRKAHDIARVILGDVHHPLCLKRLETDGTTIFARLRDEDAGIEEDLLIDLLTRQHVFLEVIEPLLLKLDYEADTVARWWPDGKDSPVVLDPKRAFGKPIVAGSGVPTSVLYAAQLAGEDEARIADWYQVGREEVAAALAFESRLAAA